MVSETVQLIVKYKDDASGEMKTFARDVAAMGTAADQAGKRGKSGLAQLTQGAMDVKSAFDMLRGAVGTVQAFADSAMELGKFAAQGVAVRDSFDQMAKKVGSSSAAMLAAIQNASKGTVSETDAMLAANVAMAMGVARTADDMGALMEVARFKAKQFGLSTTQAFSDLSRGVGRLSPMILDNLGIMVDAEATYGAYAAAIGKTADKLSDAEKRQALFTRVVAEGRKEIEAAGGATKTYMDTFERWDATSANFKQKMGENILPILTQGIDSWMNMGGEMAETTRLLNVYNAAQAEAAETGQSWQDIMRRMNSEYAAWSAASADSKTSIDTARIATQNWNRELKLIPKSVTVKAAFHVTTGPTRAEIEEEAAERLLKIPEQRAKKEELWGRIMLETARVSADQRVKDAVAALDREDRAYKAAIDKQKTDKVAFAAWTKAEEQKAAALRAEGRFKEAGEVEQGILLAQEWHRQNDTTTEGLEAEHLARLQTLRAGYNTALRNSSDENLRLQRFAYQQEQTELANMEWRIKQTMITGQDYTKEWAGNWKNASQDAWLTAKKDIQGWDKEVETTLFKPRFFIIEGKYIPYVNTTGEEDRDRGGPPTTTTPTTGGGGRRPGGQQQYQGGGVVSGALGQPRNITAHGGEIIIDPLAPMRGLAALARSGILGNKSTTINLTANYPLQSGARLADDVRLLRMMYA